MQYQTCIGQASVSESARRLGRCTEKQSMSRPEPGRPDLVTASRTLTAEGISDHLARLAVAAATGDGATALAGLVLTARAFSPVDTIRASETLCGLDEFGLAERLVRDALGRYAGDIGLGIEHARISRRSGAFAEAVTRYRAL